MGDERRRGSRWRFRTLAGRVVWLVLFTAFVFAVNFESLRPRFMEPHGPVAAFLAFVVALALAAAVATAVDRLASRRREGPAQSDLGRAGDL